MAQMDDGESEVSETKEVRDGTVLPISTNPSSSGSGNVIHADAASKKKSNRRKG